MNMTETRSVTCDHQLAKAEQMIWQLLDDTLPEQGVRELEALCHELPTVKDLLVNCVMLHTDLFQSFGKSPDLDFATLRMAAQSH